MLNSINKNKITEIIRVNHAGEMGAKVIYDGQILANKIKGDKATLAIIEKMKSQEIEHFDYFDQQIQKQKVRPTIFQPLWGIGGFAMGFLTAVIDKKSAMTCTTAVEEVIDEHYQQQIQEINYLIENNQDKNSQQELIELQNILKKFRDEEIHHRDIAYENNAKDFIAHKPLASFIKFTTKLAIAISKKM